MGFLGFRVYVYPPPPPPPPKKEDNKSLSPKRNIFSFFLRVGAGGS